jgi:NAD(P)-dependent dehydrogenase (short-subunit alcohol dehydrogenase family)
MADVAERRGRVEGKVAVVTGAASGIGKATARAIVAEGGSVVLGDIDEGAVHRVADEIGDRARAVVADVSNEIAVKSLVDTAVSVFGRLDILHNNAVNSTREDSDVEATPDHAWRSMFEIIVLAAVYGIRHAIPAMRANGGGSIITTSSGAARIPAGRIAYGSMKAAVETMSLYTAATFGVEGIRSNVIAPGLVLSEGVKAEMTGEQIAAFVPLVAAGRLCTAEEVADVVVFLGSDASAYVSGQVIAVNGGGRRSAGSW